MPLALPSRGPQAGGEGERSPSARGCSHRGAHHARHTSALRRPRHRLLMHLSRKHQVFNPPKGLCGRFALSPERSLSPQARSRHPERAGLCIWSPSTATCPPHAASAPAKGTLSRSAWAAPPQRSPSGPRQGRLPSLAPPQLRQPGARRNESVWEGKQSYRETMLNVNTS